MQEGIVNRLRSRVLAFSSSALLALSALAASDSALAAPSWSAPKSLASVTLFNLPSNTASVAVAPTGNAVAVWVNEATGAVQYARRSAGAWTSARALYTPSAAKNETTGDARVVMEPSGTAVAIFWSTVPGALQYCVSGGRVVRCLGPSKSFAKVATLAPGATSWTRLNVSAQGIGVSATQIGIDQSGTAIASWTYLEKAGVRPVIQAVIRPAGSAWSVPQTVYSSANAISLPILSVGPAGDAVLAWQEKPAAAGSPIAIRSLSLSRGAWGLAEDVAAPSGSLWTLRSAIDANGQVALVWDDTYAVRASRRVQGAWSAPDTLVSAPGRIYAYGGPYMAFAPDIAADGLGNFLVAWLETDATTGLWTIEAQLHTALGLVDGASWGVDPQLGSPSPHVTTSSDGSLGMVGWVDNGAGSAFVASHTPAAGWAQPLLLGTALWDSQVMLGSGPASQASAVWLTNTAREFRYTFMGSSYLP
jgi:hypothetical protein